MRARVIVVAGPSGSGKSRLCQRLRESSGLPSVNLDDFYKDGTDPTLPRLAGDGLVDWDDPASWLPDEAVATLERLCRDGSAELPDYDISRDGRVGHHRLSLGGTAYFLAEGIFAQEIVTACRERGLLADAICIRNPRIVTFWRRLTRDIREHRKPPLVLVRRGLRLLRNEPRVIERAVALGCRAMSPDDAYAAVTAMVGTGG